MSDFWGNLKKAGAIMGTVAAGTAMAGAAVSVGSKLFNSRFDRKRKALNEDREYELEKQKLEAEIHFRERGCDSRDNEMNLKYANEAQKNMVDVEKTKIIYANGNFKPNVMVDNNGNMMDTRFNNANSSLMNTSNLAFSSPNNSSVENVQAELLKIVELKKQNLLTDEEFAAMKKKIIMGL